MMQRTLTTHWLLQVINHRAIARSWIDVGKRSSNAVTSRREAAQYARENLRFARQAAEHFVNRIRGERWLNRRELGEEVDA